MGIEAAQDEPAAVKEHEQRKRACAVRCVDAEAQRPARSVDRVLAHPSDVGRGRHQRDASLVVHARHIDRQGVRGGHTSAYVEKRLDLRIDRHRRAPLYCAALAI